MVQGLSDLQARFYAIPKAVREAVKAEMEKQAEAVVEMMRRLAPRDQGDLIKSINWTWGDAPKGAMRLGNVVGGRGDGTMRITIYAGGSKASFHAVFQEFGTRKMAANPFFFPAWRVRRKRIKAGISRAITKAIRAS